MHQGNNNDADFAQRMIRIRQHEQDGTNPDLEEEETKSSEPEQSKNFMTRLYEDEKFTKEKQAMEE